MSVCWIVSPNITKHSRKFFAQQMLYRKFFVIYLLFTQGIGFLELFCAKIEFWQKPPLHHEYTRSAGPEKSPTAWPCALQFSRKFIKLVELLDPMQFSLHKSRSKTAPIWEFLNTLTVSRQVTWPVSPIFTLYAGYRILGALIGKTAVFAKTNVCEQYTLSAESEKSPTAWPCALQFSRKFIKLVDLWRPRTSEP